MELRGSLSAALRSNGYQHRQEVHVEVERKHYGSDLDLALAIAPRAVVGFPSFPGTFSSLVLAVVSRMSPV
jgi:hypothetical protein